MVGCTSHQDGHADQGPFICKRRGNACSSFGSRENISGQIFFLLLYDFETISKLCIWELCALKKVTRLFLSSYSVSGSYSVAIGKYSLRGR